MCLCACESAFECQRQMATIQLFKKKISGMRQRATALYRLHNGENEVEKGRKRCDQRRALSQSTVGRWAKESRDRWEIYERPRLEESLFRNVNDFFFVTALSDRINWTEAGLCMKQLM